MPFVSGFPRRFFEFRGRGRELNFETNVELEILHAYDGRSLRSLINSRALSFRDLDFFFSFFFFFDLRLVNLEPRYKFQRALSSKKEDEEARQTVTKRAATNGFSFFGSCLDPKDGKSLLLFCHCARFSIRSNCCVLSGRFACRPIIIQIQSSWASRFFISVAID